MSKLGGAKSLRILYAPPTQYADLETGGGMDLWFIALIVALTLLTWGGVILCDRLLTRP